MSYDPFVVRTINFTLTYDLDKTVDRWIEFRFLRGKSFPELINDAYSKPYLKWIRDLEMV